MSKPRKDYEKTWWRRLERFVNGERIEVHEYHDIFEQNPSFLKEDIQKDDLVTPDKKKKKSEWPERLETLKELYNRYEKWPETKGITIFKRIYGFMAVLFCLALITVLLFTVSNLPTFGSSHNPASNEVVQRYIEEGLAETGAVNIVAGMILDYRAFDTLGESHVLFIAATCVMILLRADKQGKKHTAKKVKTPQAKPDPILKAAATLLTPFILIFGIYIVLNGHLSPGGGFSGGAIIGAGLILAANAFGFEQTGRFFTRKTYSVISLFALLFYSAAKSYSFYTGANHIESIIPKGTPGAILSSGLILPLNICVGMVVACTMYGFYSLFKKGEL
ncbi:MAG: hypothetical protein HFG34_08275 [Eubacterium sp.]|nr:hypothetical protein [Eubacterium sp.]